MRSESRGIYPPAHVIGNLQQRQWTYLLIVMATSCCLTSPFTVLSLCCVLRQTPFVPLPVGSLDIQYFYVISDLSLPSASCGVVVAGITLLSGVSASTMCLFRTPPQVTIHSKSGGNYLCVGVAKYFRPQAAPRSHPGLFPSCRTATPRGEEHLTPCSCF